MNKMIVNLPTETKSENRLKGFGKFGGYKYKNERRRWGEIIKLFYGELEPRCNMRMAAQFVRIMGPRQRQFDDENLSAGSKPIRDALKSYGWIYDDNQKWLSYICTQEKGLKAASRIVLWPAQTECPNCGTKEPVLLYNLNWYCKTCNNEWRE